MKMRSIERIALIILAIILAAWALVLLLRKDAVQPPDLSAVRPDTIVITDTVYVKEKPAKRSAKPAITPQPPEPEPQSSPRTRVVEEE